MFCLVENDLGTDKSGPKYWYGITVIVPNWPQKNNYNNNNNNYGALM